MYASSFLFLEPEGLLSSSPRTCESATRNRGVTVRTYCWGEGKLQSPNALLLSQQGFKHAPSLNEF